MYKQINKRVLMGENHISKMFRDLMKNSKYSEKMPSGSYEFKKWRKIFIKRLKGRRS